MGCGRGSGSGTEFAEGLLGAGSEAGSGGGPARVVAFHLPVRKSETGGTMGIGGNGGSAWPTASTSIAAGGGSGTVSMLHGMFSSSSSGGGVFSSGRPPSSTFGAMTTSSSGGARTVSGRSFPKSSTKAASKRRATGPGVGGAAFGGDGGVGFAFGGEGGVGFA